MIRRWSALLLLAACSTTPPPARLPAPLPVVTAAPRVGDGEALLAPVRPLDRRDAAVAAHRAGLMPLDATRVREFAQLYPERDGRGVLIAILDSGIDPAVPGLSITSDRRPKLVDLRDFSGEGRILLSPASIVGDHIVLGSRRLAGAGKVRARSSGTVWAGLVAEARFGTEPAADLNGNGAATDTLMVVVMEGPNGWAMFADARGDGSIEDDRPIHDFAVAQEWFGWSRTDAPPLGVAVNLADSAGVPILHLVFDNSGHGTHVAGIAAGHRLYDVDGFDGVAPGARLLGLKIANNARGGITTSGSMLKALEYAIDFARDRRMPLVVNLSFGVGNQHEGTADIDRLIDSVLADHPDVVMSVAASNDGPGLSTLGFPASAREVIAVGATMPLVFAGLPQSVGRPDPVAFFSSRGGERSGPHVVTPGFAWSSVPRFDAGEEEKNGTSMAAPHLSGLVARLLGGRTADGRIPNRAMIFQALTTTARRLPDASVLDQGAGLPDIIAASRWLAGNHTVARLIAIDADDGRRNAVWTDDPSARPRVHISRADNGDVMRIRLRSDAAWLSVEGDLVRELPTGGTIVTLRIDSTLVRSPGNFVATVLGDDPDNEGAGTLLRIPVTLSLAMRGGGTVSASVHAGSVHRLSFVADTGRGHRIEVESLTRDGVVLLALHEPGGQPFRDVPIAPAGHGPQRGAIEIDARDVRNGNYEAVLLAPPTSGVAARATIVPSPFRLGARLLKDSLVVQAHNHERDTLPLILRAAFGGAEQRMSLGDSTSRVTTALIAVPEWATEVVVDVRMAEADWSRFTDFGVSLWRRDGRLVGTEPLNYAFGRMRVEIPTELRGDSLWLELTPADAVPGRDTQWEVEVSIRYHPESPVVLDGGGSGVLTVAPGQSVSVGFPMSSWPVEIPVGLAPLLTVVAIDEKQELWTREVRLEPGEGSRQ
jgi:subtilisin family serine protease